MTAILNVKRRDAKNCLLPDVWRPRQWGRRYEACYSSHVAVMSMRVLRPEPGVTVGVATAHSSGRSTSALQRHFLSTWRSQRSDCAAILPELRTVSCRLAMAKVSLAH